MEEAESTNASTPCCVVDRHQMIEGFEDLQQISVSRHIFHADVLVYRLVISDWQASGRGKSALAVQHLLWYFRGSDGHKTCFALFLADLKKTLAVLLDNIMLRLGKLEAKVENIYNGTGGNLTNGTSTATPSATNSEKVNVAGKHWVCLLLILMAVSPGVAKTDLSPSLDPWTEGEMAFLHDRKGGSVIFPWTVTHLWAGSDGFLFQ